MDGQRHDTIKEIKKSLRLSMNGIVSTLQRRQGLDYKINFGVEIPRIKAIASEYEQDRTLAQELWKENIRECKLLAIFLYPAEEFDTATAEKWIDECRFTEIADHLCRTLLVKMPDAKEKSLQWISDERDMSGYCGFSTLSNLFRCGTPLDTEEERVYLNGIKGALHNSNRSRPMQNAASISLMRYAEECGRAQRVCGEIESWGTAGNEALHTLVSNIRECPE